MPKKRINSRAKGGRGEREVAHYFTSKGFPSRRTVQYNGQLGEADIVVDNLPTYHVEVKFCEKTKIYDWMDQAVRDSKMKRTPIVVHRRSGSPFLVTLLIDDFLHLMNHVKVNQPTTIFPVGYNAAPGAINWTKKLP